MAKKEIEATIYSNDALFAKAQRYYEIQKTISSLQAEQNEIKVELKRFMIKEKESKVLLKNSNKELEDRTILYSAFDTERFDTETFKQLKPKMYEQYIIKGFQERVQVK